ncbi:hypothetical protein Pmani_002442 [Petrolisthes manimaculis]|uniref:Uncharacterized protein n=1 Tax=Petrolisthes manimaculis TaxID=1843537 RepID=A0AAE1QIJ9_9EUCA|nr:hypothetical protein Pmani_002442 [Petrolisthes manimaculis]
MGSGTEVEQNGLTFFLLFIPDLYYNSHDLTPPSSPHPANQPTPPKTAMPYAWLGPVICEAWLRRRVVRPLKNIIRGFYERGRAEGVSEGGQ